MPYIGTLPFLVFIMRRRRHRLNRSGSTPPSFLTASVCLRHIHIFNISFFSAGYPQSCKG